MGFLGILLIVLVFIVLGVLIGRQAAHKDKTIKHLEKTLDELSEKIKKQ